MMVSFPIKIDAGDQATLMIFGILLVVAFLGNIAWQMFKKNGSEKKDHKSIDTKLDRLFEVVDTVKKEVGEIKTQLAIGKEKMEGMEKRLDHHRDEISDLNKGK